MGINYGMKTSCGSDPGSKAGSRRGGGLRCKGPRARNATICWRENLLTIEIRRRRDPRNLVADGLGWQVSRTNFLRPETTKRRAILRALAFVSANLPRRAGRQQRFQSRLWSARQKILTGPGRGSRPSPGLPTPNDQPVFGVMSCSSARTPAIAFFGSLIWAQISRRICRSNPISIGGKLPRRMAGDDPPPAAKGHVLITRGRLVQRMPGAPKSPSPRAQRGLVHCISIPCRGELSTGVTVQAARCPITPSFLEQRAKNVPASPSSAFKARWDRAQGPLTGFCHNGACISASDGHDFSALLHD